MKKNILFVALLCMFSATISVADDTVTILSSTSTELSFVVTVPKLQILSGSLAGNRYHDVALEGFELGADSVGAPILPVRSICAGVPWEGGVRVEVKPVFEQTTYQGLMPPAPYKEGVGLDAQEVYQQDAAIYNANRYYPKNTYRHLFSVVRNQRMLRLELLPLAFNPVTQNIRKVKEYHVVLRYEDITHTYVADRHFESVYREMLINYAQACSWRRPRVAQRSIPLHKAAISSVTEWYKIVVDSEGMYRVTGADLASAGLRSVSGGGVRLYTGSGKMLTDERLILGGALPRDSLREVSVYLSTEGLMADDDYILFYGQGTHGWDYNNIGNTWGYRKNYFTQQNVYWLTVDHATSGNRMNATLSITGSASDTLVAVPERVHFEQEKTFTYKEWSTGGGSGLQVDYRDWGWSVLANDELWQYSFNLPNIVTQSDAEITVQLARNISTAQTTLLRCNTSALDTVKNGKVATVVNGLKKYNNLLSAKSVLNLFDWFEVVYQRELTARAGEITFAHDTSATIAYHIMGLGGADSSWAFDITDLHAINYTRVSLQNGEIVLKPDSTGFKKYHLNTGQWKSIVGIKRAITGNLTDALHADYLIIAPAEFSQESKRLADLRLAENNGINTAKVVTLEEIYDAFATGRTEPAAIRDFLMYTYQYWASPPAYVVLVGDGHADFRHIIADSSLDNQRNWMPPYHASRGECSDGWFASYDWNNNAGNSHLMNIGRLPVQSVEDLRNVIDKIITYESGGVHRNEWRGRVVIVADDERNPEYNGGNEGFTHVNQAEALSLIVPPFYNLVKMYLINYEIDMQAHKPDANEDYLRMFNQGALLINYIGHGAPDIIAHESIFRYSTNRDQLANDDRMPIFIAFSCAVGQFDNYALVSMCEGLVRLKGKGAIATIGATEETYIYSNKLVNQQLFTSYFEGNATTLGQAMLLTQQATTSSAKYYHLFGDPALTIQRPEYRVEIDALEPDSLKALAMTTISGIIYDSDSSVATLFNGNVLVEVYDAVQNKVYVNFSNSADTVRYTSQGACLFRGNATVRNGTFVTRFIVPKDISYQQTGGKIVAFASSVLGEGFGAKKGIFLGGTTRNVSEDNTGPAIKLTLKNYREEDYGSVSNSPVLKMTLEDPSGINIAGAVGHTIMLTMDDDPTSVQDMTSNFIYEKDSNTSGSLEYAMFSLSAGVHKISVKAWDSYNNSSTTELTFTVVSNKDIRVINPLNYPNPFVPARKTGVDGTTISYSLSQAATEAVAIRIYSVSGRFIREIKGTSALGYNTAYWDGRDARGDMLANGTYMYVIIATVSYTDGFKLKNAIHRATGYAVIMR